MKTLIILSLLATLFLLSHCRNPIKNPVLKKNIPDPGAIYYDGFYYTVSTGGEADKFPIHRSKDLQVWELVGHALVKDKLPLWAVPNGQFWAPEIHIINGAFRLYFTAKNNESKALEIGVATADKIEGPYTDRGLPLVRNESIGIIDATVMKVESGNTTKHYVVWKDDGNGRKPKIPTWIWAQELAPDGINAIGERIPLIANTLKWEDDLVEGPWIIQRGDWYYLFYSGHGYCDASYAVGVARSKNPLGPYEKKGDPILKTGNGWIGPGHCSVIMDAQYPGKWIMLYHSWELGKVCGKNQRYLMADYLNWSPEGWPYMTSSSPRSTAYFWEF